MKILREGKVEPETVRFTCRKCDCVFEAVRNIEASRIYDQREGDYWQCDCPICRHTCTRTAP